jgi:hypothetical protein
MKTLLRVAACAATVGAVHLAAAQPPAPASTSTPSSSSTSTSTSTPTSTSNSTSTSTPTSTSTSTPTSTAADAPPPAAHPFPPHVQPFASIVGGIKVDTIIQAPTEHREGRISAISVADFGLRGTVGEWFSFESELLAGGGGGGDPNTLPGFELHGSSAWQGQAQLQVRRQLVRYANGRWMAEAGRVIDEGSVDFVSSHVGDTLLQDTATVYPLLYSGFLLGNGIRGTVEVVHGLRLGLAFLGGNPVSQTGSLQVGGSFPPFNRFYIQPYQNVKQTPDNSPDDTFQMMLFAPSAMYKDDMVEARAELQSYVVDTNTNSTADQVIHGYNARGTAKLKLDDDTVSPFANISLDRNDTVNPNDTSQLAAAKYQSLTWGGGVDFNYAHTTPTRPDGVGIQYERVQYQVGNGDVTDINFFNVGTTYWFNDWIAVGARLAVWVLSQVDTHGEGEVSGLATMRMEL